MLNSETKKKDKSCILTCSGQVKLKNALSKECPNDTTKGLSDTARLDRNVISKILHNILYASDSKPQKPVTYKSLSDFCSSCLKIDLDDSDWENPLLPKRKHHRAATIKPPHRRKLTTPLSQNLTVKN
ncbi:MAG: hypothetical protein ACRDEA_13895, partial [Microcystaceae cyanobacterium]